MIEEIRISGLGVIDDATVELGPGLTVVTGETGAGKTMVVTSIGLLLGERADAGQVRVGATEARVEGRVRVEPTGPVAERVGDAGGALDEDVLIVARQLSAQGRSRAFVGGRSAPVALLGELAEHLVAVHGQSDQHRLLRPARQRAVLDAYAGEPLQKLLTSYQQTYARLQEVEQRLESLRSSTDADRAEAQRLSAALDELAELAVAVGEDAALAAEASRLAHADELRSAAETARAALAGDDTGDGSDATGLVGVVRNTLEAAGELDPRLAELAGAAAEAGYLLSDLATELAAYAADVEVDPARLAQVQERRAAIAALVRRLGLGSADELVEWGRSAAERLHALDGSDERLAELTAERTGLREALTDAATQLREVRLEAAERFAEEVSAELTELAMPKAAVEVGCSLRDDPAGLVVDGRPVAFGPSGVDEVAVLLRPHPGSAPRPLHKGASGGELSRVMLAVEVVLAGRDPVPTFVFDEVDAGVGGRAATEVGRRLAGLAAHAQVLVVTHLPQVAAFADQHLVVEKDDAGSVTASDVRTLDRAERVRELARMLAGVEDSASALAHAEELVAAAEAERPTTR